MGEKIHAIAIRLKTQEIGRVKKVVTVSVFWKALSMLLSIVGPRIKARISGDCGSPPYAMRHPMTAKKSIIPHL